MESYGVEDARSMLGDLVERVRIAGEHVTITRYGKPAAVIVPVEWYEAAKGDVNVTVHDAEWARRTSERDD